MLPPEGYTLDDLRDTHMDIETHWRMFCHRTASDRSEAARVTRLTEYAEALAEEPVVLETLRSIGLSTEHCLETVKRSLVILNEALGPRCMSALLAYSPHGTVISAFKLASTEGFASVEASVLDGADIQMTILASAVDHLVSWYTGRDHLQAMRAILNQLELPYDKHLVIINSLTPRIMGFKHHLH